MSVLMLSLFVAANLTMVTASLILGYAILPRLRVRQNITTVAGTGFCTFNALQYLDITYGLLFSELAHVSGSWHLLVLRIATAICLATMVGGIFIDVGRWKKLENGGSGE